jgi:hypothetical protein
VATSGGALTRTGVPIAIIIISAVVEAPCADHATPLYPQKLTLKKISSTSGGRSVGIVRSRTKGHGVVLLRHHATNRKVPGSRPRGDK